MRKGASNSPFINTMKVENLLSGPQGKMEVKLSSKTVSQIFALVKDDVQRVANYNSSQATHAIEEAENEMPALEVMSDD